MTKKIQFDFDDWLDTVRKSVKDKPVKKDGWYTSKEIYALMFPGEKIKDHGKKLQKYVDANYFEVTKYGGKNYYKPRFADDDNPRGAK